MRQQRRFTKEFEDEAVRLVRTSGRTQREIAEDLGVGLSTRWCAGSAGAGIARSTIGQPLARRTPSRS